MQYSEHLKLKMPEMTDNANVEDISENFDVIDKTLAGNLNRVTVLSSADGVTYVAEMPGVSALSKGLRLLAVPEIESTSTGVRLDVNGLGSVAVLVRGSGNTGDTGAPTDKNWLSAGAPVELVYNGTAFVASFVKIAIEDIEGVLPLEKGGHGGKTVAEARTNLGITPANIGAQKTVTGAASTVVSSNVTASRVLVSNASGKIAASGVTASELTALSGIGGNVQEQLDEKVGVAHDHDASDVTSGILPVKHGGMGCENVTAGSFLVGNGVEAMTEKTPAEVLTLIGAAKSGHTHTLSQVKSYEGTGTHGGTGSSKCCKLTFGFAPSVVIFLCKEKDSKLVLPSQEGNHVMIRSRLSTTAKENEGFSEDDSIEIDGKISADGKTFSWGYSGSTFSLDYAGAQLNKVGVTYYFLGIA